MLRFMVKALVCFAITAALPIQSSAETASETSAQPTRTKVFLIGGYRSSQTQVDLWASEARKAKSGVDFAAFPYPSGADSSALGAVKGAQALIQKIADEINSNPTRKFVVAGHSSGAAISNDIGSKVKAKGHVTLVSLDGFAPTASLLPTVAFKCVYSSGASSSGNSRNAPSMKGCGRNAVAIPNLQCKTSWCGHFAVINKRTPADLSGSDFAQRGYENFSPELGWLP